MTDEHDEIPAEDKAEMLNLLFADALGKLAAQWYLDGKLDEMCDGFTDGSVVLEWSVHGLVAKVVTNAPPGSPN